MALGAALLRNTASAVGGRFASTLLGVVTFAILARVVGAEGLGQYRTVLTFLLFAGTLVDLGLYAVSLQVLSRPGVDQGRMLGSIVGLRISATALAVVALALLTSVLEDDPTIRLGVLVAGFGWIGFQLNDVLRALFQQQLAQHESAIAETTGALLTLLLVLAFAALGGTTDSMLAATAIGLTWTGAAAWILARRRVAFRVSFNLREWRELLVQGLPFAGSALLMTAHFRADILLLSILRTPVEVGLYDAPGKLYELVFMLPYLFGGLLMPMFVRDLLSPAETLRPRLQAAFTVTALFGALACGVFLAHAEEIVVLLGGDQFVASGRPLRVLGFAALLAGVCAVVRYAVTALKQQHRMMHADLISLVVALAVHATLIPRYGVMGAAFGRLAGDAVRTLLAMRLLQGQLTRATWGSALLAFGAAVLLVGGLLAAQALGIHWMIATTVCGAAVLGACFALGRLRRELAALSSA